MKIDTIGLRSLNVGTIGLGALNVGTIGLGALKLGIMGLGALKLGTMGLGALVLGMHYMAYSFEADALGCYTSTMEVDMVREEGGGVGGGDVQLFPSYSGC